jgi:hypothetical protein
MILHLNAIILYQKTFLIWMSLGSLTSSDPYEGDTVSRRI